MRINWKARAKNKAFWLAMIPAVILLIQAVASVFGIAIDLSSTSEKLLGVVNAAFMVLTILGVVADPTTEGISDSNQALRYDRPRQD